MVHKAKQAFGRYQSLVVSPAPSETRAGSCPLSGARRKVFPTKALLLLVLYYLLPILLAEFYIILGLQLRLPSQPYVSGIPNANIIIGTKDMAKEQDKLATCPIFSTIICPNRFESVAPSPKQDAVSPTAGCKFG